MILRGFMAAVVVGACAAFSAESRGFPVGTSFKNCIKPNHISQEEMNRTVSDFYKYVKSKYVVPAKNSTGGYYVLSGGGTGGSEGLITISEAHGYGMITSVLMAGSGPLADPEGKEIFDGMYQFYKDHPSSGSPDLMSWQVLTNGKGGESSEADGNATDGDMDIAYALILAHYQWGSSGKIDYLSEAKRMITDGLKEYNMNQETMRTNLGDWIMVEDEWSGVLTTDPEYYWGTRSSDWMTGHMHAFASAAGDPFWTEAADTVYSLLKNFTAKYAPATGLISDFIDGERGGPAASNYLNEFPETNHYYENACRVPLRLAADFAHYGSAQAKTSIDGFSSFIKKASAENPEKITFGYNIKTGAELYPDSVSMQFTAPFIAGTIADANNQEFLNRGWDLISSTRQTYYPDYLNLLSMLLISGNWWAPGQEIVGTAEQRTEQKALHEEISWNLTGRTVNISVPTSLRGAEYSLFSLNGRTIASGVTDLSGKTSISLDGCAESVLLLRIGSGNISATQKIILK